MFKLLLFITFIFAISCAGNPISSRSSSEINQDRDNFYKVVQPIAVINNRENLPIFKESTLRLILDSIVRTTKTTPRTEFNSEQFKKLDDLYDSLLFQLQHKLYLPDNPEDSINIRTVRKTVVFE